MEYYGIIVIKNKGEYQMRKLPTKLLSASLGLAILACGVLTDSNVVNAKSVTRGTKAFYSTYDWKQSGSLNYPITSDSKEWKNIKTHDEMLEKTMLPQELLKKSSTEDLVRLALEYPLLCDVFAYDTIENGLEALSQQNPIFNEIISRKDGASKLLDSYENMTITKSVNVNSRINKEDAYLDAGNELTQVTVLEALLAQESVLNSLSETEEEELMDCVYKKVDEKDASDLYDTESTINFFTNLDESSPLYKSTVANNTRAALVIKTPKGSTVGYMRYAYYGDEKSDAITVEFKKQYPNASIKYPATNVFNCHSYAWYSTSQTLKSGVWINNPSVYLNDGSYKKVGSSPTANGQRAVYVQAIQKQPYIHSAKVTNASSKTLVSKWGQGPVMNHAASYSPYKGSIVYYK